MYVAAVSPLSSSPLSLITAISFFFQSCLVCAVPQKSHCFPMPQWRWGGVGVGGRNPRIFFSSFILKSRICLFFLLYRPLPCSASFSLRSQGWRELNFAFLVMCCTFFLTTQHGGHHGEEVTERGLDSQHCLAHKEICMLFSWSFFSGIMS